MHLLQQIKSLTAHFNNIVNMFTKLKIAVNKYSQNPVTSYTYTMFGKAEGRLLDFKIGLQKINYLHLVEF